ncbi:MAG: site-specific DNA-methyltransferase [Pseudomonadota bacterium]|jgi:adenine-specific DNA-methyltransferase|nr:site-specific DNA-methyltransferase [Pseudomonadota bacterium]
MDKLKMHSPDLTQDNIARIRELFPGCVTEAADKNDKLCLAVDFDQLRQELSDHVVEGPQERYHLDWPGKREALLTANAAIAKTLRPCREESVNFNTTKNLFIEGDNLDAVKLFQESYLGKVKMIYIDPPYNTGNDFIYEDDFAEDSAEYLRRSNQVDESGNRLIANTTSNGRFHSDWLTMIYPRLRLARNLLRDDGAIFISIDDEEVHTLRMACDEVFGRENFIAQFVWKARQFTDARAKTNVSTDHEYIIAYAKSSGFSLKGVGRDESKFSNPDNDPRGDWMSRSILGLATRDERPNLHYDIVEPGTLRAFPPNPSTGWRYSKERMNELAAEGRILFPKNDDGRPREKKFRKEMKSDFIAFRSIIDDVHTADGTQEIRALFGSDLFPFPKPVALIAGLVNQVADEEDLVMDLFSGSATTAQAVMQVNAGDGGKRTFVMVQLPEPCDEKSEAHKRGYRTIAEIGKERIRRAGKRILEAQHHASWIKDTGFRVLKVASSNMSDVFYTPDAVKQDLLAEQIDNIRYDRTPEDLLFQVLLDWGVDLSLPIRQETIAGKTVFFVDDTALAACFDLGVDEAFVKTLAGYQPLRVVFRDAGFASDSVKINVEQLFKLLSPGTEVKCI